MGVFQRGRWSQERDAVAQEMLDEFVALGYDKVVEQFVLPENSEYREVTALSGRTYTLLAEAWWEDEEARTVHLSVTANSGRGLGPTGKGPWVRINPPVEG